MNKVTIIVFTYKRAMQLDALLDSIIKNFQNAHFPIKIIYQVSNDHKKSYDYLKNKYKKNTVFYERNINNKKLIKLFKLLINPLNLYFFVRFSWIREYFDNFKYLLEEILNKSETKYVCFLTDDQIIYRETKISNEVFSLMDSNPNKYSYRFHTGDHFLDHYKLPSKLKINYYYKNNKKIFFSWNSKDKNCTDLWKYNFHVDATIYNIQSVLKLIKPMIYNMPSTLESIGLWNARLRNFFTYCLSSIDRSAIGMQLNNIQTHFDTPRANYNIDKLQKIYLKEYKIYFDYSDINESKYIYVPKKLIFINDKSEKKEYSEFK